MANIEDIPIATLKDDFFLIMEEICIDDMDEAALEAYNNRHSEDEDEEN